MAYDGKPGKFASELRRRMKTGGGVPKDAARLLASYAAGGPDLVSASISCGVLLLYRELCAARGVEPAGGLDALLPGAGAGAGATLAEHPVVSASSAATFDAFATAASHAYALACDDVATSVQSSAPTWDATFIESRFGFAREMADPHWSPTPSELVSYATALEKADAVWTSETAALGGRENARLYQVELLRLGHLTSLTVIKARYGAFCKARAALDPN
jgi:hypothetical protein